MAAFSYSFVEADGGKGAGTLDAETADHARAELRRQGVRLIDIKPANRNRFSRLELGKSLTPKTVSEFALELSGLLSAGAPLRQALSIQSSGKRTVSELARSVLRSIDAGHSVSTGLRNQGGPAAYLAEFVDAGEAGGRLEPMLARAGQSLRAREEAVKKVRSALAYPLFILALAVVAIVVITFYVAPALAPTLRESDPDSVVLLLASIGEVAQAHQQALLLGLGGTIGALFLLFKSKFWNALVSRAIWTAPWCGPVARDLEAGQSVAVLSALLSAGRSLSGALGYAARVSNPLMKQDYEAIAQRLRDGQPLNSAIQNAKYLPYEIKRLAILGERSSALPQALQQASEICSARAMRRIDQASSALGPILVIGLGLCISLLLISVLGSISGIGDAVS